MATKTQTVEFLEVFGDEILDGGRWSLVCTIHGGILQDTTKKRLLSWKNESTMWCAGCQHVAAGGEWI